ncbi:ficolin-1-like [Anopheles albimanus]|uniref:Fibrinogen C-terminal domain-containing protein n=1 Tax=Anopheles albimanus TaxID=7167 RepID=A0A8W7K6E3_ANOAL|nr:ficolin-1-like [Anopheles albimanus]
MKSSVWFALIFAAISACASDEVTSEKAVDTNSLADEVTGFSLEMLLAKLDCMEHKFLELQVELHEHREEVAQNRAAQEKTLGDFLWAIHRLESDVGRNVSVLQDQSRQILAQQTACANHDQFRQKLFDFIPKQNHSHHQLPGCVASALKPHHTSFSSCKEVPSNVSGPYLIRINNESEPFTAYCEQQAFDGGWLVVQHRFDGSLDFFRYWAEYRDGFGDVQKEFWLGLEKLHQLTSARPYELIVEIKDFSGNYGYARYNAFEVGSESEKYSLKTLGTYSGTAGDSLVYHKGSPFSTKDRENNSNNCATMYEGGWWYKQCHEVNLNGRYENADNTKAMNWYAFKNNRIGMSYSKMMIRPLK